MAGADMATARGHGGGKPRHYYTTASRPLRSIVVATLAVAMGLAPAMTLAVAMRL